MSEETKNYEIGFILKSEGDRQEIVKAIESAGFSIFDQGQTSSVKLAYPIEKQNFAQFGYIYFSGSPAKLEELKEELKMKPGVLRFMTFADPVIKSKEEEAAQFERAYASAERRQTPEIMVPKETKPAAKPQKTEVLSNEDLEKKLEEILK